MSDSHNHSHLTHLSFIDLSLKLMTFITLPSLRYCKTINLYIYTRYDRMRWFTKPHRCWDDTLNCNDSAGIWWDNFMLKQFILYFKFSKGILNYFRVYSCVESMFGCYWLKFHILACVLFVFKISFLWLDVTFSLVNIELFCYNCLTRSWYEWISLSFDLIIFILCDFFSPNLTQFSISSGFFIASIQPYSASLTKFVPLSLRTFLFRSITDAAKPTLTNSVNF